MNEKFYADCEFYWSCLTDKGHQRFSLATTMELCFVPYEGLHIEVYDEIPTVKIKEVVWKCEKSCFGIFATTRLKRWSSKSFESLFDGISMPKGTFLKLFDDNWIYEPDPLASQHD